MTRWYKIFVSVIQRKQMRINMRNKIVERVCVDSLPTKTDVLVLKLKVE